MCCSGADLEALSVAVIKRECAGLEDEGLAMQHAVLSHHDLHECLAATEVQKRAPASMQTTLLLGLHGGYEGNHPLTCLAWWV